MQRVHERLFDLQVTAASQLDGTFCGFVDSFCLASASNNRFLSWNKACRYRKTGFLRVFQIQISPDLVYIAFILII